jgi:FixJ family two-component response regulator
MDERRVRPVAVIEDDAVARTALGRLLDVGGFEPALFESAETFIPCFAGSPWLCLIVDVQLAGMSGIDLQQRIRSEGSEVPIVLITANRADVLRERAEQAGCAAFLHKPFSGTTILGLLGSIAGQPRACSLIQSTASQRPVDPGFRPVYPSASGGKQP